MNKSFFAYIITNFITELAFWNLVFISKESYIIFKILGFLYIGLFPFTIFLFDFNKNKEENIAWGLILTVWLIHLICFLVCVTKECL